MDIDTIRRHLYSPEIDDGPGVTIDNVGILGLFIKNIGELEEQIAAIREAQRQEIAEIAMRTDSLVATYQSQITRLMERFGPQAIEFVKNEMTYLGKRSVPTLWGVAGFRKSTGKIHITDMETAVASAKEAGLPVKVKETVAKKDVKKHMAATGEVLIGTEFEPGEDRFYTKYAGRASISEDK